MSTEYMLSGDAAKFLGVCKKTLYNWHAAGKLIPEVHPLTKIRMYKKEDLEKFVKEKTDLTIS